MLNWVITFHNPCHIYILQGTNRSWGVHWPLVLNSWLHGEHICLLTMFPEANYCFTATTQGRSAPGDPLRNPPTCTGALSSPRASRHNTFSTSGEREELDEEEVIACLVRRVLPVVWLIVAACFDTRRVHQSMRDTKPRYMQ